MTKYTKNQWLKMGKNLLEKSSGLAVISDDRHSASGGSLSVKF